MSQNQPTPPKRLVFHLLANAHLDPVWLWDWREGLNEGIKTVRTVLDLMDEHPELTFMRGESAIYAHIQKTDPETFKRIRKQIETGRWDVVGGTVIQPDSNLASTETLCREYEIGLAWFEKNLGVRPKVAWQADSFGHSAGFPNILSAFGMEGFCFTRPQRSEFPMEAPAFWWNGDAENRILCYRQHWKWYCSEHDNVPEVLDTTLAGAKQLDFVNAGVLFGVGDHGGGPTRRHLREIEQWKAAHPEVEVRFSTLHGFFEELRKEVASKDTKAVPQFRGEFGYCLRGCYSSVQKFKSLFRRAEAQVADAETTRSMIGAATQTPTPDLAEAWAALAFNAFHDILPGSSIERAFDEQMAWTGLALHRASETKFEAMNLLAAKVDTSVPAPRTPDAAADVPVLLWNPLPRLYSGIVELEASLDYRPIWKFKDRASEMPVAVFDHAGAPADFQVIGTEHTSMTDAPWRRRVLVPVEIPALGWTTLRLGWRDEPEAKPVAPVCQAGGGNGTLRITNGDWEVETASGAARISRYGRDFFTAGRNLELRVVEDPWGSWGGMNEEKDSYCLNEVREIWKLTASEVLEPGPLRAKLWTRWQGKNSWIDLTFVVSAGSPLLKVEGRMLWNERSARLKLVLPCLGELVCDVPGSRVSRDVEGQAPVGRWATRSRNDGRMGIATDVLSDFSATPGELEVTLARATRYAADVPYPPGKNVWEPATDCGELKFQLGFFDQGIDGDEAAETLIFPPTALLSAAAQGPWGRQGSLGSLTPDSLKLLSLEALSAGELKLRIQNRELSQVEAAFQIGGERIALGGLSAGQIKTWLLRQDDQQRWTVV